MGRKPKRTKIGEAKARISDEAHELLRLHLAKEDTIGEVVSDLITTFIGANLQWKEEYLFQIGHIYIDLPAYLKYLETNPHARIPLIEALRKIADSTTWKKFGEVLEHYEKER